MLVLRGVFLILTTATGSVSGTACDRMPAREQGRQPGRVVGSSRPNDDYFRDPVHVARVQAWRAAHPGYSRGGAISRVRYKIP